MNEHTSTEAPRQYGELYYSADSVATILRVVAELLESGKRTDVLRLSYSLPTTMRWPDDSESTQQQASEHSVCRSVQLWLCDDAILGDNPLRLTCMLRRGSSTQRPADWQHFARLAS